MKNKIFLHRFSKFRQQEPQSIEEALISPKEPYLGCKINTGPAV